MSEQLRQLQEASPGADRREFGKLALGGALAGAAALSSSSASTLRPIPPGVKIGTSGGRATEDNLRYLKQLGVEWVSLGATPETATAAGFIQMRKDWEAGGFKVYNIGSGVGPSGSLHRIVRAPPRSYSHTRTGRRIPQRYGYAGCPNRCRAQPAARWFVRLPAPGRMPPVNAGSRDVFSYPA